MLQRTAIGALVATILVVGAGTASAAKGGHDPVASSITLNQNPHLGELVDFTTTYPKTVKEPRIVVNCYQNGVLVWGEVGTTDWVFKLGGDASPWVDNGGPASCTATLNDLIWHGSNMQEWVYLTDTSFEAGPG